MEPKANTGGRRHTARWTMAALIPLVIALAPTYGIVQPPSDIEISPSTLDFGARTTSSVGQVLRISLKTTGGSALGIINVTVTGSGFEVNAKDCTGHEDSSQCMILAQFHPLVPGHYVGEITIYRKGSPSPRRVTLTGTGVGYLPAGPILTPPSGAPRTARTGSSGREPPPTETPRPPPPIARRGPFSAVDDLLAKMPLGNIVYNAPSSMALEESYEIKLLLSPSKSLDELQKELPGKVEGAEIQIANKMEARLTGQDFTISAINPEIQGVSGQKTTEWAWDVKPTSGGVHQLHLTINAILLINGSETPRSITTFDRKITVAVGFGHLLFSFITQNWQWLWTAVLIPIAAWLWKKRKRAPWRK